jgi:hypothetical protein
MPDSLLLARKMFGVFDLNCDIFRVMNHASLESIIEKQKLRYQILRKMYEIAGDDLTYIIRPALLYETEGTTKDEIIRVLDYLRAEGLVKHDVGEITISHEGVKEIEDSIQNPNKSTEHFMSVIIQHFYGNVEGGVQVGGEKNSQEVTFKSKE